MTKEYDYEEEFHKKDRKQHRKERKVAQQKDRSKFKKSNLNKEEKKESEHLLTLPRGRVISITGEGIFVDFEEKVYLCSLKGVLKKEKLLVKNLIAVGDWVRFSSEGSQGVISSIEERSSFLARTDISGKKEQLIAVNVDQVIITVSFVEPELKPPLVDRYLIAAEKGNLSPIIALNKIDLLEKNPEEKEKYLEFLSAYEPLGIPILSLSIKTHTGIDALKALLQGKTSVFSGQSGVGKSSLLNACFGLRLKIGELTAKTFKGAHTTTTAELLPLPGGGYCVDTPGIRSFGIWKLKKEDLLAHFREFFPFAKRCKYPDCTHINEPSCAVIAALEKKKIASMRYESYKTLLQSVLEGEDKQTWS